MIIHVSIALFSPHKFFESYKLRVSGFCTDRDFFSFFFFDLPLVGILVFVASLLLVSTVPFFWDIPSVQG